MSPIELSWTAKKEWPGATIMCLCANQFYDMIVTASFNVDGPVKLFFFFENVPLLFLPTCPRLPLFVLYFCPWLTWRLGKHSFLDPSL